MAFYVISAGEETAHTSVAHTPLGPLHALSVGRFPLFSDEQIRQQPWLHSYSFAQRSFQVSTVSLHPAHIPVYRMERLDQSTHWLQFRLTTDPLQAEASGWTLSSAATNAEDGVVFYATNAPDPSIHHSTPLYEFTRLLRPNMTAYAYDLGGVTSRLYTADGYNQSAPLLALYVPRPLLVDVFRSHRQHVTELSSSSLSVTSYALTVSPLLFSFALHRDDERYEEDSSLPTLDGRAGWLLKALSYPLADAEPVYSWFSIDMHGQRRYRYRPAAAEAGEADEMVRGTGQDKSGNGWMLNTVDHADGIAFYAFPSNASGPHLHLPLEAVYEVQHLTAQGRYAYTALIPQSQLLTLTPPHYELVEQRPLFYVPSER